MDATQDTFGAQNQGGQKVQLPRRRGRPGHIRALYLAVGKLGVERRDATAAEVQEKLLLKFPGEQISERWVSRELKKARDRAASEAWSLSDSDSAEVELVAPVFRAIMEVSEIGVTDFTRKQAEWVLKVCRAAPGLAPRRVWDTAIYYLLASADVATRTPGNQLEITSLDAFLLHAPWTSLAAVEHFLQWTVDNRPGWLLERVTVGAGEIRPGPAGRLKKDPSNLLGPLLRAGYGVAPGVKKAAEVLPSGVVLRPVVPGQPLPASADAFATTAGVAVAIEVWRDLEGEASRE
jgi:hypothetical protein